MKMDKDTYKSNLKTLKEVILDEQKLVTYISLSKELCIHVNDAKSLLNDIVQEIRKTEPKTELYVCYMISGLLNNNSACTTVCSETEIEELRKTLSNIFYEHVYCVSRGMQAVDNIALTAINKFEDFSLCTGLIKANSCLKRTDDEILNLKSSSNHGITIVSKPSNPITKNSTEKKEAIKNGHDNVKKPDKVKSEPVIKSKTPSPKKDITVTDKKNGTKSVPKGIAGFFSKANGDTKKATNNKVKEEKKNEVKEEKKNEVKEEKTIEVKVEKKNEEKKQKKNEVAVKVEKETKVKKTEPTNTDTTIKPEKEVSTNKSKQNSDKKSSNNSLKQIKKTAKVDKKRKRVLHVSDSESDTEANDPFADDEDKKMAVDQDSEDEIPPTPTTNTVKITSGIVNPKKRRKIVDKTYTDEDGYILTKKEEVYESCSDNEEDTKVNMKQEKENIVQVTQVKTEAKETSPKENGKSKKRKISPPQKGKQQMLTNFFKKV